MAQEELNRSDRFGRMLGHLLVLAGAAMYVFVYVPAREQARSLAREQLALRSRIARLMAVNGRLELQCKSLSARDPDEISEAIRDALHKGRPGEYILEE